jgi:hypothetical protein
MLALLGIPNLGFVAWLVISFAFAVDAGIVFLGWHYSEHHRKPRWARHANHEPVDPIDFGGEIAVHDKSRRGPERLAGPEDRPRLPFGGGRR